MKRAALPLSSRAHCVFVSVSSLIVYLYIIVTLTTPLRLTGRALCSHRDGKECAPLPPALSPFPLLSHPS